jgi:hypothetical protein
MLTILPLISSEMILNLLFQVEPSISVYTNGNHSASSSIASEAHAVLNSSSSSALASPHDLPPLPPLEHAFGNNLAADALPNLPVLPPLGGMHHHPMGGYMPAFLPPLPLPDIRPAPLGRRSPGPRMDSPSPPGSEDNYYRGGRYRRDSSPEGANRSNNSSSRYSSGRYDRYSRERSPDREDD